MKKNFTFKSFLMAAALLAGTNSVWAQDVVTNTNIAFDGELSASSNKWSYTLAEGETGTISGEYWNTGSDNPKQQGVIINADQRLLLSNGNISFAIPEAGAKDVVEVQFKLALGGQWKDGGTKNTTISFTAGDTEVIKEQYNANTNSVTTSTMGVTKDNITIGTANPDWSKVNTFTFTFDYSTKKITLAATSAGKTDFSGDIDMPEGMAKGGTFKITAPNTGYQSRGILMDDLLIQTTQRPADAHNYTVNAVAGDVVLQELATGTVVEEATFAVENLSKVIEKDGKFYVLDDEITNFAKEFTMGTEDVVETVNYTEDATIVFFAEVENMSNATYITDNAACSAGKFAAIKGGKAGTISALAAGEYTITANFVSNANRGCYLRTSTSNTEDNIVIKVGAKGDTGEKTSETFALEAETALYLTGYTGSGNQTNQSADLDYIIIRSTGTPTGINTIDNGQLTRNNGTAYNLAGQRVAQPTEGLYIINGKKIVIK